MSQLEHHLTTEQISAYLDHHSVADELVKEYAAHLQTCAHCQRELDELRQTVQVLRALPQPVLPRSFTLPATTRVGQEPISFTARKKASTERRSISPLLRKGLRSGSALVAVAGFLFIVSGFLPFFTHGQATPTAMYSNASPAKEQQADGGLVTPDTSKAVDKDAAVATAQAESTTNQRGTPTTTSTQQGQTQFQNDPNTQPVAQNEQPFFQPILRLFDLNSTAKRIGLGILLCLGGWMGFTFFKAPRKSIMRN